MASLDYRLNPIYTIKECSSCGALYNKSRCCSNVSFVDKFVRDPNKTTDSSQRPPQNCPKCGNPVDGLYCRQCALLRKKLKEVWSTICYEDEIFQDFLNTFESSNDKTNVVNAPQDPFVFNQDPGENSSQRPPYIDHHCCYGCGDSLDGIFCQRCTCKSYGNGAHYGYNCQPKVPTISNPEPCHNQNVDEFPQTLPSFHPTCYSGDGSSFTYDSTPNFVDDSPNVFNPPSQPPTYSCEFCGNDAHYGHNCIPRVPFIYNPEPCYNQDFNFPQNFQCFLQQYICCTRCGGPHETFQCQQVIFYEPCCENCGGPHETFQCQPMNYPNLCYESNYSGFDQFEPPQHPVIHQPIQEKTCAELLAEERAANIDQSPPQEMSIQDMEDLKQHYLDEMKSLINDLQIKDYRNERIDIQYRRECEIKIDELKQNFNVMSIEIRKKEKEILQQEHAAYVRTSQRFSFIYYDDDDDEESSIPLSDVISELPPCVAITPVLSTDEPDNSLSMGDEHLDTILATESNEVIKSSVEDLVLIPSESEGILDNMCDVPFHDNSPPLDISKDQFEEFSDSNDDSTSIDDNSFSIDDIDYVDASPPESELVSLEVVENENGEIDTDILLTIKDDILREKLLNVNLLIAKIEALKDNPTPSFDFVTKSPSTSPNSFLEETDTSYNSLPESETFCFNLEEKSSGNPTSHSDLSLLDYEAFFCDSEPDSGDFTMDVVEDIFDNPTREPRVHVPNVLPTHPTLQLDLDFTLSSDSLGSDLVVSFPSGTRNKIFDPGIFIEVQSKRFLSPNEFSISFISDPLSLVFDTLLPFSSENEDNIFNPGILASN
ncbi:hypothetical protein Tco_0907625 [Tanacetum coccineum]|uniref:Uncharacterized protein n=1 Tax=Tanacetum coccineum TaxID=301880 RepID=A0ABQ5CK40_9ASTR